MEIVVEADIHRIDVALRQQIVDARESASDPVLVSERRELRLVDVAARDDAAVLHFQVVVHVVASDDSAPDDADPDRLHIVSPLPRSPRFLGPSGHHPRSRVRPSMHSRSRSSMASGSG
jgi:hypothetical protein